MYVPEPLVLEVFLGLIRTFEITCCIKGLPLLKKKTIPYSSDGSPPENKANQTTLLVSRPPVFLFLCGRAVIIYSILWHFEGVVSWNRPNN